MSLSGYSYLSGCLNTVSYGIGRFVFGKDNPQEPHLHMFPEIKTTLMDYRSARYLCTALSELSQGTVEILHMKDYFLFGLLAALSCHTDIRDNLEISAELNLL